MGFVRKLTGADAAEKASRRGAKIQTTMGQQAFDLIQDQTEQSREDLAPFLQFAQGLIPQAEGLFGSNAATSIINDPAFGALADEAERRIMASQAARGRLGTEETPIMLQDALLRTGVDLLGRQRGDFLSALGLGSGVATNLASVGGQSAAQGGDLLTQIANAQASGLQGQAMAKQQGFGNLLGLGALGVGAAGGFGKIGKGLGSLFGLGGMLGGVLCDRRAKRNITFKDTYKGHKLYKFQYKHRDEWFIGPMADEVKKKCPKAVFNLMGYDHVSVGDL